MADITTSSTATKEEILEQIVEVGGEGILDTVSPKPVPATPPAVPGPPPPSNGEAAEEDDNFVPTCITQRPIPKALRGNKKLGAIMVGLNHECPRWTPGSVIKWVVIKEGFKKPEDADYAAQHLNMACQKWNELDVGVTFEWVEKMADATFALWHGGDQGRVMASAFFPNPNELSNMLVYNPAFSMPTWKTNMWKVFMHELGHVLGLRHEFAMDIDEDSGQMKELMKAAQLGPRDPDSVMTYKRTPPEISRYDIESTKAFYALREDANGNAPVVGLLEVQDYDPM